MKEKKQQPVVYTQ